MTRIFLGVSLASAVALSGLAVTTVAGTSPAYAAKKQKLYKAPEEKKSGCVFGSRNKRGGIQLCRGR